MMMARLTVLCAVFAVLLMFVALCVTTASSSSSIPELSLALLQKEVSRLGESTLLLELYVPGSEEESGIAQLEQGLTRASTTNKAIKIGRIVATPEVLKQWLPRDATAPSAKIPSLVVIRENVVRSYTGPLMGTAISTYFSNVKDTQVVKKFTKNNKRETVDRDEPIVVGFFANEHDRAYRDFEKAARILQEEAVFAATFEPKVAKTLNLKTSGSIMMHEPFEKKIFRDDDGEKSPSAKELVSWFDANKKNVLPKVNAKNLFTMFKKSETIVLGVTSTGASDSNRFLSVLHDVAASNVITNTGFMFLVKEEVPDYTAQIGIDAISLPRPIFVNMRTTKQFIFPEDKNVMSKDDIISWIQSIQSGSLQPTIKSAPEPTDNTGPIFKLTANSFDAAVLNSDKNVMVKFYAPWCQHCRDMAPAFEHLGSHFRNAGDDSVRIAEFDAAANDPKEAFNIRGFPTLLFFRRGNPDPIPYNGQRTFEAMKEFIEANKK